MTEVDYFHQALDTNIGLLQMKHKIDYQPGQFKQRNQEGFESLGHGLLKIIDPVECKKSIPWPLLKDTKLRAEFRSSFVKFIKTIKIKHPEAQIHEIKASTLHFPGGEKFIKFMMQLATLALEIEIKRHIGAGVEELLPLPKMTGQRQADYVRLASIRGAHAACKDQLNEISKYLEMAIPRKSELKALDTHLSAQISAFRNELEDSVCSLDVDEQMKTRLLNLNDTEILSEWKQKVEEKVSDLEASSKRFQHIRDWSDEIRMQLEDYSQNLFLCLDGRKINTTPNLDQRVRTTQGHLSLKLLLDTARLCARDLAPASSTPDLCPYIRDLLEEQASLKRAANNDILLQAEQMNKNLNEEINRLRPTLYAEYRTKAEEEGVPQHFKYLKNRPPILFNLDGETESKRKTFKRKSFSKSTFSIFKGHTVKRRRSLSNTQPRYNTKLGSLKSISRNRNLSPETTVFRVPTMPITCKRSLYGKLPRGSRIMACEASLPSPGDDTSASISTVDSPDGPLITSTPHPRANAAIPAPLSTTTAAATATPPSPPTKTTSVATRGKRRSIDAIVARFNRIKSQMDKK